MVNAMKFLYGFGLGAVVMYFWATTTFSYKLHDFQMECLHQDFPKEALYDIINKYHPHFETVELLVESFSRQCAFDKIQKYTK